MTQIADDRRIGFIGLGLMGAPMARNLALAGFEVTAFNRTPEKARALEGDGVIVAADIGDLTRRSDVVITMLPDSPDVEAVLAGPGGVFEAAAPGLLVIDMSTISPVLTRELGEKADALGLALLDAPVSGGDVGAQQGTLAIMVGGSNEDVERAAPIFDVLGSTITHVGPCGAGQITKVCNQIVVGVTLGALSEGLVLGERAGVDPARILDAIRGGFAGSNVLEAKGSKLVEREFEPGFRVRLHDKDLRIALESARAYGVETPLTAEVERMLTELTERGMGDLDSTAMITVVEESAAVE